MNRKIEVSIQDVTGKSWQFERLRTLLTFLENEARNWRKEHESITGARMRIHNYIGCHSNIEQAVNEIIQWSNNNDWDDGMLGRQIQDRLSQIESYWLWSGHPYSSAFVQCNREHGREAASAFIEYVVRNQVQNKNNSETFVGTMLGYEFLHQESDIVKRRKAEKASINRLRNWLDETNRELIDEVEDFKSDFNSWSEEAQKNHDIQQNENKNKFEQYMDDCKNEIQELENTYQEKLRMKKPADYWKKAADKFSRQGRYGLFALIGFLLFGVILLACFYINWLMGREMAVQLDTIQGVVIFGALIAVYAFLVRTLSRLSFSAFHLMRDAEEREQLTYLYLSLIDEKKIDEASRDIILQALFSRSETGLLAGETGPTMPNIHGLGEMMNRNK